MEHQKSDSEPFGAEIPQEQDGKNARSSKQNVLSRLSKPHYLSDPTYQNASGAQIGRAWPERLVPVLSQEEEAFLTGISNCEIFSLQQSVAPRKL